ncbi:hypothetical protein VOLCADRAFT_97286 [Volvox carteri f. nagariensis]|uniref:PsbP C-terminal domain-containing protein n=1 Tax=Volvox carteri f. nagariensis TaxID=3068 RepID=D8UCD2_VOLCA|nr:uncharacterized protein VOLCADRAFT_97286 [Volvox carteri f. nagariensis]EFJ42626.1 hypothetical protein VOLCADRAFT_97286 [Volvox carteri f. nagariensis]|eukprot:XP_002956277.1 hypothetical protein VOLCADRAFT_97286 [Volvox carteri f. nagariensis]
MTPFQKKLGQTCQAVVPQQVLAVSRRARRAGPPGLACPATPPGRPDTPGPSSIPSTSNDPPPRISSGPGPNLSDPVQTIYWGGTLPNTRRAVLGAVSGAAIALGGNLGGITSWLLGLDGGSLAGRLRADVLVPVRGAKRCVDYTYGFDPATVTSAPGRSAGFGGGSGGRQQRPAVAEPVVAFGPPGTTGEENVSVIVAPIAPGFTLGSLGDPRVAGERFLATLAPEGSGLQATLLDATARIITAAVPTSPSAQYTQRDQQQQEQLSYYTLEYTVRGPRFFRHNVSVYTSRNDLLYTFNAQCPEARWTEDAVPLLASAASFKLL